MKKLISLILVILMIAALIVPTHASGETFDKPSAAFLVQKIEDNSTYQENDGYFSRWIWRITDLPSSDGKEVWLMFSCVNGYPGNGTIVTVIRTEEAVYTLSLMLNYYTMTELIVTTDTTLPAEMLLRIAETRNWDGLATRGSCYHYVSYQADPETWHSGAAPIDLTSDLPDPENSELYAALRDMAPYLVDVLKYELLPAYTIAQLGWHSIPTLCRWHVWDEGIVIKEPTAAHMGLIFHQCERCGKTWYEYLPRLRFEDVPETAYYAEAVDWATENGVVAGTSETDFSPNAECTRAQIVQMLWRAAGSPETETETPFIDIPDNAYYSEAVAWAYENGITNGTGPMAFSPNRPCTRAQIVTMLWRANGSPESNIQTRFADVTGSEWYAQAVRWAAGRGITAGKRGNTFAAFDVCTRAEAVTFLWRADGREE